GEVAVVLARLLTGDGGDLGGEQAQDETVLIRAPRGAVEALETRPGAFLTREDKRSLVESGCKPLEPDWHLEDLAIQVLNDKIDQSRADHRLSDLCRARPSLPMGQEITDRHCQVMIGTHQSSRGRHNPMSV